MRKLLSLATFLFFVSALNAQNWCPPGAAWIYDTGNPWVDSKTYIKYLGDTVIEGYVSQRFDMTVLTTEIMGNDTLINTHRPEFFTTTDGDVVWEYNGTTWDTLYWFSALPGDRWTPFWPYGQDCPDSYWLVTDTSTTVVDGFPLRTLSLIGTDGDFEFNSGETIMERIGGNIGGEHFPGHASCSIIYECYCDRICYSDQDIVPPNGSCALTLNVHETLLPTTDLTVMPQPANTHVQISSTKAKPLKQLLVYDASGKIVLNETISNADRYILAVEQLPEGYYVLRATDVTGAVSAVPLVIAR